MGWTSITSLGFRIGYIYKITLGGNATASASAATAAVEATTTAASVSTATTTTTIEGATATAAATIITTTVTQILGSGERRFSVINQFLLYRSQTDELQDQY